MRAHQLHRRHQRVGEQHRPQQTVAELRAGLGISGDAARIVVGSAGDDAGTDIPFEPRIPLQPRRSRGRPFQALREAVRPTVDVRARSDGAKLARKLARDIPRQAESLGEGRAKQRIAERVQDQREGGLGDVMLLVADAELSDEAADRVEDWVESVAVAGEDHPGGERAGAFAPERVEGLVDDDSRIGLAGTRAFDRFGDARGDRVGDRAGELALKAGSRAEMMEQVGMGAADPARDSLERDCRTGPRSAATHARRRARRSGFLPG